MIELPQSAPLPWAMKECLRVTTLVDANGQPVIRSDDDGLIASREVWAFVLAAVNAYAYDRRRDERAAVLVPRRPELPMDTAFIGYLNECDRKNMMPTIAALWPRLLDAALRRPTAARSTLDRS
ncbi:hypothetical protein [Mesorhizobium sp.]|uniref:hypothetical protein n=1 Tax=Mesorhizobium sp. TaxID=1871066 RepID=UPI000FEAA6D1|nr:hypothetical protein [Mesorhizobium sp.]RWF64123.1 MAG: hypothetical protein EOS47_16260 [Mesorhizobium sp.]TIT44719.1 MAG: hypothetical protein E5W76_01180 [Mesorhizobium sp.]